MNTKKKIPAEKIKDFQIKMNGQEICAKGSVVINGIGFGIGSNNLEHSDGIVGFELILSAGSKPEIIIEYKPRSIKKEVADALGLERDELRP
ncbi:hypothetical protein HXA35_20615 [Bacillus sp. A301a_S52]|jgi:hypothetical protein|nr:hypothetical protein [Bacillus sp. A301a_S52]